MIYPKPPVYNPGADTELLRLAYLLAQAKQKQAQQAQAQGGGNPLSNLLSSGTEAYGIHELLNGGGAAVAESALPSLASESAMTFPGAATNAQALGIDMGSLGGDASSVWAGADAVPGFAAMDAVPGIAGAAAMYDVFKNKRRGARGLLQGGLGSAGLGYTAAALVAPEFTVPIMAAAALLGGGSSLLNKKSTKEKQEDRWNATSRTDLADAYKAHDYFAGTGGEKSRDESFLTADAIRVNPDNYNNIPDWDSWDKTKQDAFLNDMLSNKKVTEKKGGIYYDDEYAKQVADKIRNGVTWNTKPKTLDLSSVQPGFTGGPKDVSGWGGVHTLPLILDAAKSPQSTLANQAFIPKATQPDAGTLKRWRENKERGVKGYSGR